MKKTIILLMSVLCFSIIQAGCKLNNIALPEKVDVKVDATYEFPILSFDSEKNSKLDMSQYFDMEKMFSGNGDEEEEGTEQASNSKFNVYKYNNGSKFQQYLLHMPVKEIDFDFGSAFENFDISTAMQGFKMDQEFEIPDVGSIHETQRIDLSTIETAVNSAVSFYGETSPSPESPTFVSASAFDEVTYVSGKLVVSCDLSQLTQSQLDFLQGSSGINFGSSFSVNGSMALYDPEENLISSAAFNNNEAELNIAGKTLYSEGMHLVYSGSTYGVPFIATFSNDTKIKVAKGVTIPSSQFEIPPASVSFPVSLGDNLESVTVTQGTLSVDLQDPASWAGNVIRDYSISVTGGLECTVTKATTPVSLVDVELRSEAISAEATVSIVLNNATIDFTDTPIVSVNTDIDKFSAVITMPDSFDTTIQKIMDVPTEVSNFVEDITWNELGFRIKANNKLPQGNDFGLKIWSDFMGIEEDEPQTILSGTNQEQVLEFVSRDDPDVEGDEIVTDFTTTSSLDVEGEIIFPGGGSNIQVCDVEPGKTYSISLNVEPVFDWKKATVKMPEGMSDFSGEFNTNINKSALFQALGDDVAQKLNDIRIDSIPLYLFASLPDLDIFDGAGFEGTIKAYYGVETDQRDEQGNTIIESVTSQADMVYILGSYDSETQQDVRKPINFTSMPALTTNDNNEVITVFDDEYKTADFADAINLVTDDPDSALCIKYDVGLSGNASNGIEITSAQLESLKQNGKCSISMDLAIVLTLDFTLADQIEINLMDFIAPDDAESEDESETEGTEGTQTSTENNSEEEGEETEQQPAKKDILNRTSAPDTSAYEDYLQIIESATLSLEDVKLPFTGALTFKVNWYGDEEEEHTKEIKIKSGQSIPITIDNPAEIISLYPLAPDISLVIGEEDENNTGNAGTFGLLRNAPVSGSMKLKIKTNGDETVQVYPFTKQDDNGGSR